MFSKLPSLERFGLSLIGVLALCPPVMAAPGEASGRLPDLQNVRFSRIGTPDGLASATVTSVVEDREGVVWLGTDSGLCRYDGSEIRVLRSDHTRGDSLSSDHISVMTLGPDGDLWIGTSNGGLNRFDPITETARLFQGSQSLPGSEIVSLAADQKGNLWVGTGGGLARVRLEDGKVTVFEGGILGGRVNALLPCPEGAWVGMFDGRLFQWVATESQMKLRWRSSSPITAMTVDRHDALWIGTQGTGLFRMATNGDPETRPIPAAKAGIGKADLPGKSISGLHCDHQGHLWVATTQGLCRLDRSTRRSAIYRTDPLDSGSISGTLINALCEDSNSVLWIATDGAGVSRLELDRFGFALVRRHQPGAGSASHSAIWGFRERPDGSVWVATESGLKHWHPVRGWLEDVPGEAPATGSALAGAPADETNALFVQSLWEDGFGRVWMGTRGEGLVRIEADGTRTHLTHGPSAKAELPHDSVTALHQDLEGRLWVGTMGGGLVRCIESGDQLSFLSAITVNPVPESEEERASYEPLPECRHVTAIARDGAGRTWVASWEGLFLLDRDLGRLTHYLALDHRSQRLSSDGLLSLASDGKGFLWVGTVNSGLNRFDPATGEVLSFDRPTHGLPDDRIAGILPDEQGYVWVSSGRGVARLTPETGEVRTFGEGDGLQRGAFHVGAAVRLKSGNLLLGGASGFNVIDPDCLPKEKLPSAPVLAGISISGEPLLPRPGGLLEQPLARTMTLELPYDGKSRLSIRLAPGEIVDSDLFYYRFRLEEQDLHWSISGHEGQAVYTGLNPGQYRFLAQTSLDGRRWSENMAALDLVIRPPWYRTWWAWGVFGLGSALLVWLASTWINRARIQYQRRMREQAEQQRDRAEAELARQLQHALLLEQAGREMGQNRSLADLFGSAMRIVADQFGADHCAVISCGVAGEEGAELEGREELLTLATYPPTEDEGTLSEELQSALRHLLEHHELFRIDASPMSDGEEADSGVAEAVRKRWAPEGTVILRRTTFLDEINGAILLTARGGSAVMPRLSMNEGQEQMLEALCNQVGTAIAQWRIAEKERLHRGVLENARHAAESANQAKSDFLAKMTHELRTPLNAILGFSEVMNEDPDLNDRQREVMAIINNSGEHLHEVINGVLDLAKIEAGKIEIHPARFELERMLRSLHKMLSLRARSKGLEFPLSLLTALPRVVETDKSKLRQILINLLGNAVKFTDSGSISLVAWAEAAGAVVAEGNLRKRPVRLFFEVRDTGKGIASEDLDSLFEQYTQTESGKSAADSTGLGLAIAKAFAELLGGGIEVESELGRGTVFRLSIACEEISGAEMAAEDRKSPIGGTSDRQAPSKPRHRRLVEGQPEVRILIAEDQLPNRLLLRKLLEPAGFVLREAEDGAAAVEQWREWRPHLIFMDEQMPKMTGREATRAIVAEASGEQDGSRLADSSGELPVIVALTAFALDQSRSAAIEAGCSDFLAKPFRSDELFGVIARNLPQVRFEGDPEPTPVARDRNGTLEDSDSVMLAG